MAAVHPLPLPPAPARPAEQPKAELAVEQTVEQALVPAPLEPGAEAGTSIRLNDAVARLPVELDVAVPVRDFRVRSLLALEPGQVIETQWAHGEDMPLAAGEVQLAWTEFEVVESELAVRVTRLV